MWEIIDPGNVWQFPWCSKPTARLWNSTFTIISMMVAYGFPTLLRISVYLHPHWFLLLPCATWMVKHAAWPPWSPWSLWSVARPTSFSNAASEDATHILSIGFYPFLSFSCRFLGKTKGKRIHSHKFQLLMIIMICVHWPGWWTDEWRRVETE